MPNPIVQRPLVEPGIEMPSIFCTILTGKRPDLLRKTLEASKEVLDNCKAGVAAFVWSGESDQDTCAVLADYADQVQQIHFGDNDPNGLATSRCGRLFLESDADVWLTIEDDWLLDQRLATIYPEWFQTAAGLAMNPQIGQVRLRDVNHLGKMIVVSPDEKPRFAGDGSGCANVNWVSGKRVEWTTDDGWPFMVSSDTPISSPAHLTNNPSMWNRCAVAQVYWSPVLNEHHAMDRYHAARTIEGGRFATAQMRPGVYVHAGDGRSLEGH